MPERDFVAQTFGRFRTRSLLAAGGTAAVYEAHDETSGKRVALKVFDTTKVDPRRTRREYALAERFRDDSRFVTVLAIGCDDEHHWIAMEFVDGGTLADYLKGIENPCAPENARELLGVVVQVAEAIHALHVQDILYRDLKPSNVLLSAGRPILCDFGTAKPRRPTAEEQLSEPHVFPGTLSFASPEQVQGRQLSPASDVWALGVLAYVVFAKQTPWTADEHSDLMRCIVRERAPRLPAAAPRWLQRVLDTALSKDPRHRQPSARCFAEDLARVRAGERPTWLPSVPVRLWRWVQREPLAAGIVLLLLVLLGLEFRNARLERANSELVHATAELRRENLRARARRNEGLGDDAAAIGSWETALVSYRAAMPHASDPVSLELKTIEALDGALRPDEARARLRALLKRGGLGVHADRARLLSMDATRRPGFKFVGRASRELKQLLQRKNDLDPADAAYARALLTADVGTAILQLKRALGYDPHHRRANEMLVPTLILAGHFEEAARKAEAFAGVFHQDPGAIALRRLCARVRGERMPDLPGGLPAHTVAMLRSSDSFYAAWAQIAAAGRSLGDVLVRKFLHREVSLGPVVLQVVKGALIAQFGGRKHEILYRVAPAASQAWTSIVLESIVLNFSTDRAEQARDALTELMTRSADGYVYFARALADIKLDDVEAAAADMYEAALRPSMMHGFQKAAITYALVETQGSGERFARHATHLLLRAASDPGRFGYESEDDGRFLRRIARSMKLGAVADYVRATWKPTTRAGSRERRTKE